MKAITICEPYASAIIHGPKRVENRPNPWRFRGRLLVHAGKSMKFMGTLNAAELATWPQFDERKLVFGAILGSVEVYDCVDVNELFSTPVDPWACGPFCLLLRDPRPFEKPVPFRGMLGLFDVPDELVRYGNSPFLPDYVSRKDF